MRAYIIRTPECMELLKKMASKAKDGCINYKHHLLENQESFYGVADKGKYEFRDTRIPTGTKLPINMVKIERGTRE